MVENSGNLPSFILEDVCKIYDFGNYRQIKDNKSPYLLCAFQSNDSQTGGYHIAHIPAQTYDIFPSEPFKWDEDFSNVLSTLQKRFYTEWLPTADYDRIEGANFEIYGGTGEYGYIELWYPVVKKIV